jgi:hypothetical protein
MNSTSRFLVEAVGAMILVGFGGGSVPTASACFGDACNKLAIVGTEYAIVSQDPRTKITITGCTVPLKGATDSESACVRGSKFETTIPPGGKWTGPPIAHGMDRLVLTAHYVFAPIDTGCTSEQLHSARGVARSKLDDQDTQAGHQYDHALRCESCNIVSPSDPCLVTFRAAKP